MVYVGLEPPALLREVLRHEGGKIAPHLRPKAGLSVYGGYHRLRRIQVSSDLVEHMLGIRFNPKDGLSRLL